MALSNVACSLTWNEVSGVRVGQRQPPACGAPRLILILLTVIKVSAVKLELATRGKKLKQNKITPKHISKEKYSTFPTLYGKKRRM